jgi:hypothetical protein
MRRPGGPDRLIAALCALAACGPGDDTLEPSCATTQFLAASLRPLPHNVLGVALEARLRDADSVGIRFGLTMERADSMAPPVAGRGDSVVVPVLGLLPETTYLMQPVAWGRCGPVDGPWLSFTTGALPADLPRYRTSGSDPSPGYVVIGAMPYGLVIDNTGRVVWYHRFPEGTGLNFQAQPNGHFVARPPVAATAPARWIEIDPLGAVVRTMGCARGLSPRFHDLILEGDGSYWTLCDEIRTMDLSSLGGYPDAQVMGTVVQRLSPEGLLLFEWNPFDHFALTDVPASERAGRQVNWTHGNALDLTGDRQLVVSFRNLNEITKIDTRTGAVIWRMGGLANQFTWEDTPAPAFLAQHGLRVPGGSELLLLDNLGHSDGSRAERYRYDEAGRTVRLVQSYGADAGVMAQLGGNTQSLPGGRALVAFGNGGRLAEYDDGGRVVWRIEGDAGYVFRAQRILSLYHPGVGTPR